LKCNFKGALRAPSRQPAVTPNELLAQASHATPSRTRTRLRVDRVQAGVAFGGRPQNWPSRLTSAISKDGHHSTPLAVRASAASCADDHPCLLCHDQPAFLQSRLD
jgi:hypothetical protein